MPIELLEIRDVEVLAVGEFEPAVGPKIIKITESDLDNIVSANAQLSFKPFLKIGHHEKQAFLEEIKKDSERERPTLGEITELRRVKSKLLATFSNVPKKIHDLIVKTRSFPGRSAEILFNFKDSGKTFSHVLKAVAFLGATVPAVSNLKDIEALFGAYENERAVIFNHISEGGLNVPDKDKVQDVTKSTEYIKLQKDLDDLKKDNKAKEVALKKNEAENLTIVELSKQFEESKAASAVEIENLKKRDQNSTAEIAALLERGRISENEAYLEKITAPGNCKIIPAERPLVIAVLDGLTRIKACSEVKLSFNDGKDTVETTTLAAFKKLIEGRDLSKIFGDTALKTEILPGTDDPGVEIANKVAKLQKEDKDLDYMTAFSQVSKEHPELAEKYAKCNKRIN